MRYADARVAERETSEIYRVYVAEHLRVLCGTNVGYYEVAHGTVQDDFDAEQVVDDVLTRMGIEGD